jgi:hypothetical protein
MVMGDIIALVATLLGGGGVGFYLNYLINNRETDHNEFKLLLQTWQEDNVRLREREVENATEIKKLRDELSNLKTKLAMLEATNFELPLPQWFKDVNGTMLSLNSEYESTILVPKGMSISDYIGRKDEDIFGIDLALEYRKNDMLVMRNRRAGHFEERVTDEYGNEVIYHVFKYPKLSGGVIVGIGGIIVKEKDG